MDLGEFMRNSVYLYLDRERSYTYIAKKCDWRVAFVSMFIVYLIAGVAKVLVNYATAGGNLLLAFLSVIAVSFISLVVTTFILYGLVHLFLEMFGGVAKFYDTIKFSLSLGFFPAVIMAILNLFALVMNIEIINIIVSGFLFIMAVWTIVISVLVFAKLHRLREGKAFLAIMIALILVLGVGVMAIGSYSLLADQLINVINL